jgi:hypothetical protein
MRSVKPAYLLILLALSMLSCSEKPRFELLTSEQTGVSFINRVEESDTLHLINFEYIYNGAGIGIADLNNDGWQDIVFTANQVSPRIYLNRGDWTFSEITHAFEDIDNGQWYSGVTFSDINMDGRMDVYLTSTAYADQEKRKNRFYVQQEPRENGELFFRDMAGSYGIADSSFTVHASFLDYDLDGDLDLYLLNNFANDRMSASYRAKINDGTAVSNDDLYRNNGDGTFSNVSLEAGIVYEGFGLGLAVGDVNKDGFPDLYVSDDYVANDLFYINQGNGTFKNEIARYFSYQSRSSMGNDMADINNDGYPDVYTLDMLPMRYHKKKQTLNGFPYIYYLNDATYGYEHQYIRNMLHLHNGMVRNELIPFSEVGQIMGVFHSEWSWSPLFADYDNDGDKDLLIANGYPTDMTDKDWTKYKVRVYGNMGDARHVISRIPAVKVPNVAFENTGELRFENQSEAWFEPAPSYSYGAAFADLDNDGDLDYVVNNLNDEAFLYMNRTTDNRRIRSNYLQIELRGDVRNPQAIGAKIELWSGGTYQFQEHFLSRGYVSSMDPVVHFGLGKASDVDSVKVTWPGSNNITVLNGIEANQRLLVDANAGEQRRQTAPLSQAEVLPFTPLPGWLPYQHQQTDIIDYYFAQTLLPHKFSQIGPRMQLGDLNGDGQEDLLIGSTNLLPTTVQLWDGERFKSADLPGLSGPREFSEADLAIFDVDGDGDHDVAAIAGGYALAENRYIHYLYFNNQDTFTRQPLPVPHFSASVIRPCDYDHDGDQDLFIGARIRVGAFPTAPDSWILVNESGRFRPDLSFSIPLGMVTDALWSDVDGDGWEDLMVAREWNSLVLLKNMQGEELSKDERPELESLHGIWYSLVAGDFDQDGHTDYLAGNLGENHRWLVNREYPLRIYALDVDLNGTLDPIATGYWENELGEMEEYPIHYLDELANQSPTLANQFKDYTSFSHTPFKQILDEETLSRVEDQMMVNTTSSLILWNRGDRFEPEKLPRAVQVSPIKKMLVLDYNHDPYPDVLLAGNDHTYDIATGYFDASKGFLLASDRGEPLKKTLPPSKTGLILHGMVESLLYLDHTPPYLIAGMNRDSIRTYRINW